MPPYSDMMSYVAGMKRYNLEKVVARTFVPPPLAVRDQVGIQHFATWAFSPSYRASSKAKHSGCDCECPHSR
jgi:hypothetical protein